MSKSLLLSLAFAILTAAACRQNDADEAGGPPGQTPGEDAAPGAPPTRGPMSAGGDNPDGAPPAEDGAPSADAEGDSQGALSPDAVTNIMRPEVAPGVELARGLIFYLPLDDGMGTDVLDSSSNRNRAQLESPVPTGAVWTGGWRGGALRFAGLPATRLLVESSESLDRIADGFTIAFWYRRDDNRAAGVFLTRAAPMDRGCMYCAELIGDRLRLQIYSLNPYRGELRTDQPVPTGRWVHLAFSYDQVAGQMGIFVDGNLLVRGPYAHPIGPQVRPVVIGEGLTGTIDEITLHSRGLSLDEVKALALGADPTR